MGFLAEQSLTALASLLMVALVGIGLPLCLHVEGKRLWFVLSVSGAAFMLIVQMVLIATSRPMVLDSWFFMLLVPCFSIGAVLAAVTVAAAKKIQRLRRERGQKKDRNRM